MLYSFLSPEAPTNIYKSAGGVTSKGPTASVAELRIQTHRHMKTVSTGQQQAASQNLNQTHIKRKEVSPQSFQSRTICHMLCSVQVKHVRDITLNSSCIIKYTPLVS